MRIAPRSNRSGRRTVKRDVQRARKLAPVPEPVCACNCPDYDPAVGCHRFCQAAQLRLSSDPLSPLEPLIAPLTFELKRLGVFHPCWSCEGHNDQAGQLWKLPRVWFYANSVVHIRALGEALDRLYMEKRVSARWLVTSYLPLAATATLPYRPATLSILFPSDLPAGRGRCGRAGRSSPCPGRSQTRVPTESMASWRAARARKDVRNGAGRTLPVLIFCL